MSASPIETARMHLDNASRELRSLIKSMPGRYKQDKSYRDIKTHFEGALQVYIMALPSEHQPYKNEDKTSQQFSSQSNINAAFPQRTGGSRRTRKRRGKN